VQDKTRKPLLFSKTVALPHPLRRAPAGASGRPRGAPPERLLAVPGKDGGRDPVPQLATPQLHVASSTVDRELATGDRVEVDPTLTASRGTQTQARSRADQAGVHLGSRPMRPRTRS
jgi:hypothetical protein